MVILQIHFDYTGGYGEQMLHEARELAESINNEPGFMWKIWTENQEKGIAGGIYAFDSRVHAEQYAVMHMKRLTNYGMGSNFQYEIMAVNEHLSGVNQFRVG